MRALILVCAFLAAGCDTLPRADDGDSPADKLDFSIDGAARRELRDRLQRETPDCLPPRCLFST